MNIFILDTNIEQSASYHCNKHVVKMLLESVQLLSSAYRINGMDVGYKLTHKNHPCSIWVRESLSNIEYLKELIFWLHQEWKYRFNHTKNHKSYDVFLETVKHKINIEDKGLTSFAQAMPEQYKQENAIEAYREYYRKEKLHIAEWTKRDIPEWFNKKGD